MINGKNIMAERERGRDLFDSSKLIFFNSLSDWNNFSSNFNCQLQEHFTSQIVSRAIFAELSQCVSMTIGYTYNQNVQKLTCRNEKVGQH